MKNLFIIILMAFLLSGCVTTVSMLVDGKPSFSPSELSYKLSVMYPKIGIRRIEMGVFPLGEWSWWDKPNGGFIGHDVKKGLLRIWIAPARGLEGAPEVKEKILKLLSEIAPDASVQISEVRGVDLR